MNNLDNREYYIMLFDIYGDLLTAKQQDYFQNYFFYDLSLSEIAENFDVSRNAIYDQITKIFKILEKYEEKLMLYKKYQKQEEVFKRYENSSCDDVKKLIDELKNIE